jgi:hypothetical protein
MPKGKKKKNRKPRVNGYITSIESVSYFTVDDDEVVRVGPNTRFSGVAVDPTGLVIGMQVACVGKRNKDKLFTAEKINVETYDGPDPVEPEEPEEDEDEPVSPITPTPDIEPEPLPEPAPPDSDDSVDDSPPEEEEQPPAEEEENNAG